MSIQKTAVVHLIGGLASAASSLSHVINADEATKSLLSEIKRLSDALADSPVTEDTLSQTK